MSSCSVQNPKELDARTRLSQKQCLDPIDTSFHGVLDSAQSWGLGDYYDSDMTWTWHWYRHEYDMNIEKLCTEWNEHGQFHSAIMYISCVILCVLPVYRTQYEMNTVNFTHMICGLCSLSKTWASVALQFCLMTIIIACHIWIQNRKKPFSMSTFFIFCTPLSWLVGRCFNRKISHPYLGYLLDGYVISLLYSVYLIANFLRSTNEPIKDHTPRAKQW